MLLTFRALSGEWADQARPEAKAAIATANAGGGATEAMRRLRLTLTKSMRIAPARSMAFTRR